MLSDYEITKQADVGPIKDIAAKLGVDDADLLPYGDEVAKVHLDALTRPRKRPGKPRSERRHAAAYSPGPESSGAGHCW